MSRTGLVLFSFCVYFLLSLTFWFRLYTWSRLSCCPSVFCALCIIVSRIIYLFVDVITLCYCTASWSASWWMLVVVQCVAVVTPEYVLSFLLAKPACRRASRVNSSRRRSSHIHLHWWRAKPLPAEFWKLDQRQPNFLGKFHLGILHFISFSFRPIVQVSDVKPVW